MNGTTWTEKKKDIHVHNPSRSSYLTLTGRLHSNIHNENWILSIQWQQHLYLHLSELLQSLIMRQVPAKVKDCNHSSNLCKFSTHKIHTFHTLNFFLSHSDVQQLKKKIFHLCSDQIHSLLALWEEYFWIPLLYWWQNESKHHCHAIWNHMID